MVKEGQNSDTLYIIQKGVCEMFKKSTTKDNMGFTKIISERIMDMTPGSVFGEITLLFDKPSTYTV